MYNTPISRIEIFKVFKSSERMFDRVATWIKAMRDRENAKEKANAVHTCLRL
jgi:hypothetical protein